VGVREHHAPVGALRPMMRQVTEMASMVREHHAPVGALRLQRGQVFSGLFGRQGAPRTCRCIETLSPRPAGCCLRGQGAPRTCRCIETPGDAVAIGLDDVVREHHAPVGALRLSQTVDITFSFQRSGSTTHL